MAKNEYSSSDVQPIVNYGHDGSELKRFHVDSNGNLYVLVSSLPLPTGAATEAKQDDTITQLTTISGKLNLVPADYDYVSYGYTGSNITTIVYKTGGAGGTTVMTKTLAYDGSDNLTSVTIT